MAVSRRNKRPYRSREAYIGGVCAGLANYFNVDTLVVRILAIILFIVTFGIASIAYLILWIYMPLSPEEDLPVEVLPESAQLSRHNAVEYVVAKNENGEEELIRLPIRGLSVRGRVALFVPLVVLAIAVDIVVVPYIPDANWWQGWPFITWVMGLFLILVPIRSNHATSWVGGGAILAAASMVILVMSLGIVSWTSLLYTLQLFWPILLVAIVLYIVGTVKTMGALIMCGACCFILFFLVGGLICTLPGPVEFVSVYSTA